MTDENAIDATLTAVDPTVRAHALLRRNGRSFMALPADRSGAIHTLNLYQPQRPKAVLAMVGVRLLAAAGLHRVCLPKFHGTGGQVTMEPKFAGCVPGTAGVMLGSPEHRVRRAILSYETENGWEVAKLAFGIEGRKVIDGEYSALGDMPLGFPGIPQALGVHHGEEFSMLRLPYFSGLPLPPRDSMRALGLLESWIRDLPILPASEFPEWPAICKALETTEAGRAAIARLAGMQLRPVIRHGDFARWNLLDMDDGKLMAIDWEWGHPSGMSGLDLVHYFLQDARLVERLAPADAIRKTLALLKGPACAQYLAKTGWNGDPLLPLIASLAWKQGAGHQENGEMVKMILNFKF